MSIWPPWKRSIGGTPNRICLCKPVDGEAVYFAFSSARWEVNLMRFLVCCFFLYLFLFGGTDHIYCIFQLFQVVFDWQSYCHKEAKCQTLGVMSVGNSHQCEFQVSQFMWSEISINLWAKMRGEFVYLKYLSLLETDTKEPKIIWLAGRSSDTRKRGEWGKWGDMLLKWKTPYIFSLWMLMWNLFSVLACRGKNNKMSVSLFSPWFLEKEPETAAEEMGSMVGSVYRPTSQRRQVSI